MLYSPNFVYEIFFSSTDLHTIIVHLPTCNITVYDSVRWSASLFIKWKGNQEQILQKYKTINYSEHILFSESSLLSLLYLSLWEHLLLASLNSNRSIKSVILEKKCYSHKLLFEAELHLLCLKIPSSISFLAKLIYKQWGDY